MILPFSSLRKKTGNFVTVNNIIKHTSIRTRLLLILIILIVFPTLFLNMSYIKISNNIIKQKDLSSMRYSSAILKDKLENIIKDCMDLSTVLYSDNNIQKMPELKYMPNLEQINVRNNINNNLQKVRTIKSYIYSIYLIDFTNSRIFFADADKNQVISFDSISKYGWYKNVMDNYGRVVWIPDSEIYRQYNLKMLLNARLVNNIMNRNEQLGMLLILINISTLTEMLSENTEYRFLLIDENDNIISDSDYNNTLKKLNECYHMEYLQKTDEIKINNELNYTVQAQLSSAPWKLILTKPIKSATLTKDSATFNFFLLSSLLWIFALICLSTYFILKVSNPISKLRNLMSQVEKGVFDITFNARSYDEIGQLGRSFNVMVSKIKQLIFNIEQIEKKRKEAELSALQAQINPHFLHNTLDIINWKVQQNANPEDISDIVISLSNYYRFVINNDDVIIPVKREIEHIETYLYLQKIGYEDKLRFHFEVDKDILNYKVLKFILQPIVENSLIHGILKKSGIGTIAVKGYKSDDSIVFEIVDDGAGMDNETLKNIFNSSAKLKKGYGVKNVNDRIKLIFGDKFGLEYMSEPGTGTSVKVTLPVIS